MVRNVSDSQIFLKKGVQVVQVMSASPVLPMELSLEMEATLGAESQPKPMSMAARQKLLEKLNRDGLAHWFPENAVAVRLTTMCLHWRAMSWVVPVPLSMRYASRTASLLRSGSGVYLLPC